MITDHFASAVDHKSAHGRRAILSGAAALAALPLFAPSALAQGRPAAAAGVALGPDSLRTVVEQLIGAKVEAFGPAPIPGLYEAIVNGNVYYVDSTGKYVVDGHIVDVATRSSLTAKRKMEFEQANSEPFDAADLNFADAIKTVYGKPTPNRVLVTFEDPRCGFCRKLHQDISGIENLVVYTFQVSFLGDASRRLNEAIWCSSDRPKAWADVMKGGTAVAAASCDLAALDRNMDLARKYRVTGTPTMYTATGRRIVGAVGREAIEAALKEAQSS